MDSRTERGRLGARNPTALFGGVLILIAQKGRPPNDGLKEGYDERGILSYSEWNNRHVT